MDAGAEIEALMAEYAACVLAKAPERLAALYAADVRVFDAWDVWSFEGRDGWARSLGDWLGSLGEARVQVTFDGVQIAHLAETGMASAFVTYSAADASGRIIRSLTNRLSWFVARRDGRWVVVHEHGSAPIGFADMKAILRREPVQG